MKTSFLVLTLCIIFSCKKATKECNCQCKSVNGTILFEIIVNGTEDETYQECEWYENQYGSGACERINCH